jgi:uncharacterized protein (DUF697 family)
MAEEGHLIKAAIELAQALNRAADKNLPAKLAEIVKVHAGIAVASAFIPIPGADMAAAATNIWAMYVRINKELNLPFGENIIKSLGAGVATNLGGAAAAFLVAGAAAKFVPGLGSIAGAALMGATIYGLTVASGIIYMKAISMLLNKKNLGEISESDLRAAAAEQMADRNALKDLIKSLKKGYKAS